MNDTPVSEVFRIAGLNIYESGLGIHIERRLEVWQ